MSEVRIVIKGRGNWEQTVAVGEKTRITIGRAPENDIVFGDLHTSAHHAMITRKGESFIVRDLDSRNGTFVNRARVTGDTPVQNGDVIHVGISDLTFRSDADPSLLAHMSGVSSPPLVAGEAGDDASSLLKMGPDELQKELREARHQIRVLRVVSEFSAFLAGRGTALEILHAALSFMAKQIGAENGFIMQVDPASGQWSVRARHGDILDWTAHAGEEKEVQLPMSLTVVEQVIRTGQPVVSAQTLEDPRFDSAKSIESLGILSCLCFPLLSGKKAAGVVYADRRVNIEPFTRTEERMLEAMSAQLARILYS